MTLDLRLQQRMTQQLVMSPQLQQAIKLLQLSHLEMADVLRQEMETNPLLEEGEPYSPVEQWGEPRLVGPGVKSMDLGLSHQVTLVEHLRWQIQMAFAPHSCQAMALYLVDAIDDDGYLSPDALQEVVDRPEVTSEQVDIAVGLIQECDPLGVGARDLRECLMLQAQHMAEQNTLVLTIIDRFLPHIQRRAVGQMAKELQVSEQHIAHAVRLISQLDPKPGRRFCSIDPQYITPDLYVYPSDRALDGWAVVLNDEGLPNLKLSERWHKDLNPQLDKATQTYIQQKTRTAHYLLRSIEMRQETIYRVMRSILRFQCTFFDDSAGTLKPLVLRQVAQDVEMHESTISRVTTNKYVHTPRGIFELKFFFNSAIRATQGEDLSSESVRQQIERLITAENPHAPLSDQSVVDMLRGQDIDIARRTVAKYREMLKIPPSSRRRRVFDV